MRFAQRLLVLVVVLLSASVALSDDKPSGQQPVLETSVRKTDDKVEIGGDQKQAVLDVTCPSGIGGATLTRTGDRWPESITLRLHLSGLESLKITAGDRTWSSEVQSHGDRAQLLVLAENGQEKPIDKSSADRQEIRILDAQGKPTLAVPNRGGCFELLLPQSLLKGQPKSITLFWIDFYRG